MSINDRLTRLEEFAGRQLAGNGSAAQWAELQTLFMADPDRRAILDSLPRHSLRRLLLSADLPVWHLQKALGIFLRENHYQAPESAVIYCRAVPGEADRSVITTNGDPDGPPFLQIVQCIDNPKQPERPAENEML